MAENWTIHLFGENFQGMLIAILPPGAFIVTGFLIALKNIIDAKQAERAQRAKAADPKVSKRVRTTGAVS